MTKLKALVESSDINALQMTYDGTERLDAAYALKYNIDFASAYAQAKAVGAGSMAMEFIKLGSEIKDKFNRMDKLLVGARSDLKRVRGIS